jgi:hypothetical protein
MKTRHHIKLIPGVASKQSHARRTSLSLVTGAVAVCATALITLAASRDEEAGPVIVQESPAGYRDWRLISVAHEEGNVHSFAAVLGNDVAIKAYREGKLPFPDGTMIASLHYHHVSSEENNKVFGREQSFVAGDPSNVQFMIKDSQKYASTGGWGFGHFQDGKPLTDKAKVESCFDCHARIKERDLVFTLYAP